MGLAEHRREKKQGSPEVKRTMAKTRPKDSARTKTAKAKSRKVARWLKEFDGLLEECGVLAKKGGHFDESTVKVVLRLVRGVSKTMDITWKEDNSGPSLGPVYVEVAGLLGPQPLQA